MKKNENGIISLYEKLLEISEKEKDEIASCNIDKIEYCWSLKEDLIRDLEKQNNGESWVLCPGQGTEIEALIHKIVAVNKANKDAIIKMKDALLSDISTLNNGKKAVKAYQAL